jgi:hypothetical protein
MKPQRCPKIVSKLKNFQKINHISGIQEICNKERLAQNLKKIKKHHGHSIFPFEILSYVLPQEYLEFKDAWKTVEKKLWISKLPRASLSRGIQVLSHWSEVPLAELRVIQKYIHEPYLYKNLKVEIRLFVLVTSISPLRVFTFPQNIRTKVGLANFTSDPASKDDLCVHAQDFLVGSSRECSRLVTADAYGEERNSIFDQLMQEGADIPRMLHSMENAIITSLLAAIPVLRVKDSSKTNGYNR